MYACWAALQVIRVKLTLGWCNEAKREEKRMIQSNFTIWCTINYENKNEVWKTQADKHLYPHNCIILLTWKWVRMDFIFLFSLLSFTFTSKKKQK